MERRSTKKGNPEVLQANRAMFTGMLYTSVLSATTKKYVLAKAETKMVEGKNVVIQARDCFDLMRKAVEELMHIDAQTRPQKMDIGSFSAAQQQEQYSYDEWVAWQDEGAPEGDHCHQRKAQPQALTHLEKARGRVKARVKAKAKERKPAHPIHG